MTDSYPKGDLPKEPRSMTEFLQFIQSSDARAAAAIEMVRTPLIDIDPEALTAGDAQVFLDVLKTHLLEIQSHLERQSVLIGKVVQSMLNFEANLTRNGVRPIVTPFTNQRN